MQPIDLTITRKQQEFISATEFEVLYGGAAGGGKSYGQLIDAYLYALKYPRSQQLILRRTFPDLERSLIRVSRDLYRQDLAEYNGSKHTYTFINGSVIDFGYVNTESDVYQYQSAQYDTIRFDELTHFPEFVYTYLISRCRGANSYPKQIKSSTNPGNIGHGWVRARFVDPAPPGTPIITSTGNRRFIPARVQDNTFLMETDPDYVARLEALPPDERKALLYGSWDVFQGQYFSEFSREKHVIRPFQIPDGWKRVRSIDWGYNDPCAIFWYAIGPDSRCYVYRELTLRETLARDVARRIVDLSKDENIAYTVASPDMWQRRGATDIEGESIAETFARNGCPVSRADNNRIIGWNRVREFLADAPDGTPSIQIFETCLELIRTIPLMVYDDHNVEDVADGLPDHWCESLRYFCMSRPSPYRPKPERKVIPYSPFETNKRRQSGFFEL